MARWGEQGEWIIEPLSQFINIVQPTFEDLLPEGEGTFDGFLNDFVVMDDVPYHKPIVDITPKYNILQRRDASCELVYKQIGKFGMRDIETYELYGGTQICKNEFYSQEGGSLRNFRDKDMETFGKYITPFFLGACRIDMATNCWFGDITRTNLSTYQFSVCAFPGIFQMDRYLYCEWHDTYFPNIHTGSNKLPRPGTLPGRLQRAAGSMAGTVRADAQLASRQQNHLLRPRCAGRLPRVYETARHNL